MPMTAQIEGLKQFEEDMNWITEHYENLKQRYPEQYVVVYRHTVVAHDKEIGELMVRLRKKYGEGATSLAIEFITAKKDELIL